MPRLLSVISQRTPFFSQQESDRKQISRGKLQRVAKPNDMKLSSLETYAPGKMSHQKSLLIRSSRSLPSRRSMMTKHWQSCWCHRWKTRWLYSHWKARRRRVTLTGDHITTFSSNRSLTSGCSSHLFQIPQVSSSANPQRTGFSVPG